MKLHELGLDVRLTPCGNFEAVIPQDFKHQCELARLEDVHIQGCSGPPHATKFLFAPKVPKLIYATLGKAGLAASVILNGVVVYHEDDDDGHSQTMTAAIVAKKLAKALKLKVKRVTVRVEDAGGDEWNHDLLATAAIKKAG